MPSGFKTDPPWAKAKHTSNGGSASGITELRMGKSCCATTASRGVRICERNNSADTKVSEEGGGGGAPGAGVEIPLQPMEVEEHGEAVCSLAAHGGPWWSRDSPAARGEPHAGAGGCALKEAVTPWEARAGVAYRQDLWPHGERTPRWSRFAGKACDPMGDPLWSSLFLKDCTT
ncbi:EH domain-containing protein 4 [Grus japonensis]|uniref:EH domain-containing protein 4 n=1 Tax=Grus japonensis TaxID=30415 RepID=A0ABC9Y2M9_GRUJA